jgi:hypothetical protein
VAVRSHGAGTLDIGVEPVPDDQVRTGTAAERLGEDRRMRFAGYDRIAPGDRADRVDEGAVARALPGPRGTTRSVFEANQGTPRTTA